MTGSVGAANLRDLGGLRGAEGRRVRTGELFRSEFPVYLDEGGPAPSEPPVRTVVDLRRDDEIAFEDRPWDRWGVTAHRVPLSAGGQSSWQAGYHAYLVNDPEGVARAVGEIVRPDARPVLFFCAAGKDRTGVVAALLLAVLGVDRAAIVGDYERTADGISRIAERLATAAPYAEVLASLAHSELAPRAELVVRMLDWVDARGGAQEWLVAHGVPVEHLDTFSTEMLEATST